MSNFPDLLTDFDNAVQALKVKLSQDPNARITYNGEIIQSIAQDVIDNYADIKDELNALVENQQSGVIVFQTYALLDAYVPTSDQETGSFKVVNDPDTSLNGYYSYDTGSTSYTKDADLVVNAIDEDNTSEAVSGAAVYEHTKTKIETIESALTDIGVVGFSGDETELIPIATDSTGKIIIGYNNTEGSLVLLDTNLTELVSAVEGNSEEIPDKHLQNAVKTIVSSSDYDTILGYSEKNGLKLSLNHPLSDKVSTLSWSNDNAVNGLIWYGQSLAIGTTGTPALTDTQLYNHLMFNGGVILGSTEKSDGVSYESVAPLIEENYETGVAYAAEYVTKLAARKGLISSPDDHVIFGSAPGLGNTSINSLDGDSERYLNVFLHHIKRASLLNGDYALKAVAWAQGEFDAANSTTYADYYEKLVALSNDITQDAYKYCVNQDSPVFFITYQTGGYISSSTTVPRAQFDAVKNNEFIFLSTPTYFLPHTYGDIHLNAAGYKLYGAYVGRVYEQLVIEKRKSDWLEPLSVIHDDSTITLKFKVPTLPLVVDTTTAGKAFTNHGFYIEVNGLEATLSSVVIDGDSIIFTPSSALTSSDEVVVRYGLDEEILAAEYNSNGGNIHDSTNDTVNIDGTDYTMWHWCPYFEMNSIYVGE